jgi:hypothetical protein
MLPKMPERRWIPLVSLAAALCGAAPLSAGEWPLVLAEDFAQGADRWSPTDPEAWSVENVDDNPCYRLLRAGSYQPPHRSPFRFALLKDVYLADFVLEARVRSTTPDYPHRDMVLIFGYQDPAHFYYVHFGKQTDDHANQVFIVNAADRAKISLSTTDGTPWDDAWHHVKLVRRVEEGTIEVYFDDLETPAMRARDRTFAWGQVGLGSFDDTGDWDDVTLRGVRVKRP